MRLPQMALVDPFDGLGDLAEGHVAAAIRTGGLPVAAGLALADRMQHRPQVTCCFFGEGAAAEGEFHESMNLAALWRLPVLFVCENNLYATATPLASATLNTEIASKAASRCSR